MNDKPSELFEGSESSLRKTYEEAVSKGEYNYSRNDPSKHDDQQRELYQATCRLDCGVGFEHTHPDGDRRHPIPMATKTCLSLSCPERTGGACTGGHSCACKDVTCEKDCVREHTHKTFWCEQCAPEKYVKTGWQDEFDSEFAGILAPTYLSIEECTIIKSYITQLRARDRERIKEAIACYAPLSLKHTLELFAIIKEIYE